MSRNLDKTTKQNAKDASVADLRALLARFEQRLEEERIRLARELHDDFTQKLTVVALELSMLELSLQGEGSLEQKEASAKVVEIGELVSGLIKSVRKLKSDLRPKVLDEFGLIAGLEWASSEFQERTGLRCSFLAEVEQTAIDAKRVSILFRMFQEILANITRHAHAGRVDIRVREEQGFLLIQVNDDGDGITSEQVRSPKSLGLLELFERASALGGSLEIAGVEGGGTTVMIRAPLAPSSQEPPPNPEKAL